VTHKLMVEGLGEYSRRKELTMRLGSRSSVKFLDIGCFIFNMSVLLGECMDCHHKERGFPRRHWSQAVSQNFGRSRKIGGKNKSFSFRPSLWRSHLRLTLYLRILVSQRMQV
jgi:hypothetical protein